MAPNYARSSRSREPTPPFLPFPLSRLPVARALKPQENSALQAVRGGVQRLGDARELCVDKDVLVALDLAFV